MNFNILLTSLAAGVTNPISPDVFSDTENKTELVCLIAFSCLTSIAAGVGVGCAMGLSSRKSIALSATREVGKIALVLGTEWISGFSSSPLRDIGPIGAVTLSIMNQKDNFLEALGYSCAQYYLIELSLSVLRCAMMLLGYNKHIGNRFNVLYSFSYYYMIHKSEKTWFFQEPV